jgi:hypothetical protein
MRVSIIIISSALALVGCFSPKYGNGHLKCSGGQTCPDSYHCAVDDTCWKDGSDPDLQQDMALGGSDDGGEAMPDLAPPPPVTYPPASVWTSCGGGVVVAASGAQLATSMCEMSIAGTATGSANGVVTFGYFSDDIF